MTKNKHINKTLLVVITTLLIIVGGLSGCIRDDTDYYFTHLEIGTGVLEKDSVKVFYRLFSPAQKSLAGQSLEIIYTEYEICSDLLNLPIENLFPLSFVFCKSDGDIFCIILAKIEKSFAYVDGVLCWSIVGEESIPFKDPINGYMLCHVLPHEVVDSTIVEKGMDRIYGAWFTEGVAEYAKLMCAQATDHLNNSYWLNMIEEGLIDLSKQEERIVNLSNRSTFAGFGAPGSEDEYVFYIGSLTYIYDLVDKFGDEFISDVIANNCTTYEELRASIENSTGYNINGSIMNVSVGWIKQRYISILEELNVDYK